MAQLQIVVFLTLKEFSLYGFLESHIPVFFLFSKLVLSLYQSTLGPWCIGPFMFPYI